MNFETPAAPQHPLFAAIVDHTLQSNDQALVRHLAQVMNIAPSDRTLVITTPTAMATLHAALGNSIDLFADDPQQLPYQDAQFDAIMLLTPIVRHPHAATRELARVLKPKGRLGAVVLSLHRDYVADDAQLATAGRSAAAYRALLAESGFTAFVSENRRAELRRMALANYRQHLLPQAGDTASNPNDQALNLLAAGSVGVTLITAEKA